MNKVKTALLVHAAASEYKNFKAAHRLQFYSIYVFSVK